MFSSGIPCTYNASCTCKGSFRMSNEESSRKESITARDSSKSLSLKELIHAVPDELIASEEERERERESE